jgi:hypothetical protein
MPANVRSHYAFSRKESHLRVIGDRTNPAICRREVLNSISAELLNDLGE